MKKTDYISALTNIDDCFVEEAAFSSKSAYVNKRKIVLLVAAVMMAIMLVACSTYEYVESIEIEILSLEDEMIEYIPDYEVKSRVSYGGQENKSVRLKEIAIEKGYNEEITTSFYACKKLEQVFVEAGAFHTDKEAFAFLYTNVDNFAQDTYVYLLLESEKGGAYKCQKVTIDVDSAYEVVISVENGWKIKAVYMQLCEADGSSRGGSEGWPLTGKPRIYRNKILDELHKVNEKYYTS